MKRYGKEIKIDQKLMNAISRYMEDETRESLHCELHPCEPEEFIIEYIKIKPLFENFLEARFGITL